MITVGLALLGIVVVLAACALSQRSVEKTFYVASIIPPALFCLAMIADRIRPGYEVLLPLSLSLALSFLMLVFGITVMVVRARRRELFRKLIIPTLVAGLPLLYAALRTFLR